MLALGCCLASCNKAELVTMYSKQNENILKYIKSEQTKDSTLVVDKKSGTYRITRVQGWGADTLDKGYKVTFRYAAYKMTSSSAPTGSNLIATNDSTTAAQAKFTPDSLYTEPITMEYPGDFVEGLKLGMNGVRSGGEYEVLFSGEYGHGKAPLGTLPANSAMLYKLWIIEVK